MKTRVTIKIDETITITVDKEPDTARQNTVSPDHNLVRSYTYGQPLKVEKEQSDNPINGKDL